MNFDILENNDKQFIEKACKIFYKSKKCKSCKRYKKINDKMLQNKKNSKIKIKVKTLKLLSKQCDKCSSNKTKKCNSKQMKDYSKWYYGK